MGNVAISQAVRDNDLITIKKWVLGGSDPSTTDHEGKTALHIACEYGYIEIVHFLIEEANNRQKI